jgi:hypothetical protein
MKYMLKTLKTLQYTLKNHIPSFVQQNLMDLYYDYNFLKRYILGQKIHCHIQVLLQLLLHWAKMRGSELKLQYLYLHLLSLYTIEHYLLQYNLQKQAKKQCLDKSSESPL